MSQINPKEKFGQAVSAVVRDKLAPAMEQAGQLFQEYWDCGYDSITDEDLERIGFTKAELDNAITMLENFDKFCQGTNPANADYSITINKFKRTL